MGIPVILATAAACGSLVTTMKSGWELSRMMRQKRDQMAAEEDAARIYRALRRALHSGRMSDKEYDHWLEKFLVAGSERNLAALRGIKAHLRIVNGNGEKQSRRHGGRNIDNMKAISDNRGRRSDDHKPAHPRGDRQRHYKSVRFDMGQTHYVPDPPQRFQDVEWPQSAGSIECFPPPDHFPAGVKTQPHVVPLARLQRSSSISYQPSHGTHESGEKKRVPPKRQENERGRSRRRKACDVRENSEAGSSDLSYHEKLGYRSRR